MIISWKTNVFSQLSRNPPKIDGLPIILFFPFLDNVFSLKTQKTRFYKNLENRPKTNILTQIRFFSGDHFPGKLTEQKHKKHERHHRTPSRNRITDLTSTSKIQKKTHTHKTKNHHAMRHGSWKSSLNT